MVLVVGETSKQFRMWIHSIGVVEQITHLYFQHSEIRIFFKKCI